MSEKRGLYQKETEKTSEVAEPARIFYNKFKDFVRSSKVLGEDHDIQKAFRFFQYEYFTFSDGLPAINRKWFIVRLRSQLQLPLDRMRGHLHFLCRPHDEHQCRNKIHRRTEPRRSHRKVFSRSLS